MRPEGFSEDFPGGRRGGPRGHRGPHHRGPGGPRFGGRRRGRGDVRAAVLLLLTEGPMHGYQLMQTITERTGGKWSPSPGAVYPTLSQLEDEGLVTVSNENGRKLVSLTDAGRQYVEENEVTWPTFEEDPGVNLRDLVMQVGDATRQIGRSGDEAQREKAAEILTATKRSLYLLLAGEAPE